jgi:hypothetical protein
MTYNMMNPNTPKTIYIVSVDTRGLPATDLQEGFEELECSRKVFVDTIVRNPKTRCVTCPIAEVCGLTKHLKLYFHEYMPGKGISIDENEESILDYEDVLQDAWSEYFPLGENNPGATLLTLDPTTGFASYNVQGLAFCVYDDGHYPLSKEQVWGLAELANEAKDVYFCDGDVYHHGRAKYDLAKWCTQYRKRSWGPSSIYAPRKLTKGPDAGAGGGFTHFSETCLI